LGQEIPENGTVVPKHVGVMKDCTTVYVVCASGWFSYRKQID